VPLEFLQPWWDRPPVRQELTRLCQQLPRHLCLSRTSGYDLRRRCCEIGARNGTQVAHCVVPACFLNSGRPRAAQRYPRLPHSGNKVRHVPEKMVSCGMLFALVFHPGPPNSQPDPQVFAHVSDHARPALHKRSEVRNARKT
jgi:hypothetical protein